MTIETSNGRAGPQADAARREQRARLFDMLRRFRVGMLVTRADDFARTQPVAVALVDEGEDELDFITIGDSDAARDLLHRPDATVVFQNGPHCAAWTGTAEITRDPSLVVRLWREHMTAWFPAGPHDLRLVVMTIRGHAGEYWDISQARRTLTVLRRLGRAVEGAEPQREPRPPEEHAFVRIADDEAPAERRASSHEP